MRYVIEYRVNDAILLPEGTAPEKALELVELFAASTVCEADYYGVVKTRPAHDKAPRLIPVREGNIDRPDAPEAGE